MSIQEYFEGLEVVHSSDGDCAVCDFDDSYEPHTVDLSRFTNKVRFWVTFDVILALAALYAAVWIIIRIIWSQV